MSASKDLTAWANEAPRWEAEICDPYSDRRLGQVQKRDGKFIAVEYVRDQRALWPVKKGASYDTFEEARSALGWE